jgi:Cellulase (glycosyl hydrolase family 5)
VRKLLATTVCVAAVLVPCGSAAAHLIVGINDDSGYEASVPSFFMPTMQSDGLTMNALTIRWDDSQPTSIDPTLVGNIQQVIGEAASAGVTVELDLYPLHSQVFTNGERCAPSSNPVACGNTAKIQQFAAWTAMVAQTFPTVHNFIVMNECNQPLFVNPQWNTAGANQSAEVCGRALAAAYDALKAVSSGNFVWGVGLSPRGNDAPNSPSNSSTSPVHFLEDLGAWFKTFTAQTHRAAPLMDGLDFHPYPIPQSLPFAGGYADQNDASVTNLPRIYQAFYSGFNGSQQRTIGEQKGGGLPVSLNEMGIQTEAAGMPGYQGTEVSATPAGGLLGVYATQAYQATYYRQMLAYLACDPNVRVINIFHLVDEPDLQGWQSGLYWFSPTSPVAKQSAAVVSGWIAQSGGNCQGTMRPWHPVLDPPPKRRP